MFVLLFKTWLMRLEWLTKPLHALVPCSGQIVLDTGATPRKWPNLDTVFDSPHPRATVPIPVLTRS
jgi:hypothetical protein